MHIIDHFSQLHSFHAREFGMLFLRLLIFFSKITSENIFQEYHQSVKMDSDQARLLVMSDPDLIDPNPDIKTHCYVAHAYLKSGFMSMRQVLFSHWFFDRSRIFVNFLAYNIAIDENVQIFGRSAVRNSV